MQKLGQYLTVGQAAEFLGVCAKTLRNWARLGKVQAARHPVNHYRLYRREQLIALLAEVAPERR
jgi:MerR family transcriptional regulator, copper efflux regulator